MIPVPQSQIALAYSALPPAASRPLGLDPAKYQAFPPGVYVSDKGFRRRASADGKQVVECEYICPFGLGPWFERYVLGYSDVIASPGSTDANPLPGVLTRTIPLQCPEPGYFHLYASDIDLIEDEKSGACYQNPFVVVRDGFGDPVIDPNLPALQAAAIAADLAAGNARAAAVAAEGLAAAAFADAQPIDGQEPQPAQIAAYQAALQNARAAAAALAAADQAAAVADAAAAAAALGTPIDWPCRIDPVTGTDGISRYRVVFSSRDYQIRSDQEILDLSQQYPTVAREMQRYLSRSQKNSVTSLQLPGGAVTFVGGPQNGQPVPTTGSYLLLFITAIRYVWHDVPDVPEAQIRACVGKTNSDSFDGALGALRTTPYPPGTLLMQAPLDIIRKNQFGRYVHDIVLEMLYRSSPLSDGTEGGWNALPDNTGAFRKVQVQPGGVGPVNPLYFSANFSSMFALGPPVQY